jgi:thymidylate kinase
MPVPLNPPTVPDLIIRLCTVLNEQGIQYCHWKSNAALDRSLRGENDLDLLVSRADAGKFTDILSNLEFKLAHEPSNTEIPGILNYYGYDARSDVLVHVHAHYQLILGHDGSKNYHLPIEKEYLASAVACGLLKIPSAEFELFVFVIRMVLKHSAWDSILTRQGRLTPSEQHELRYYLEVVTQDNVNHILRTLLPWFDGKLFEACLDSLQTSYPIWKRIQAANQLQNLLTVYARHPRIIAVGMNLQWRISDILRRRVFQNGSKKHFSNGGLLIGVVGGDGAGKTTLVNELTRWFSKNFQTTQFHLGKPEWSFGTILVRGILKIGRTAGLYPFERAEILYTTDERAIPFPGYPWLIREVCTARDRWLTYQKAQKVSTNGSLVICDRYPLPQIKLMDGAQVARMTGGVRQNWFIKWMAQLEEYYYSQMLLPDILIVLKLTPEIAVSRKTDESPKTVYPRSNEIWDIDWSLIPAHVIDASRPVEEIACEVKSLVWSYL